MYDLSQTDKPGGRRFVRTFRMLLLMMVLFFANHAGIHADEQLKKGFQGRSFSLYVLSRGKGIPDDTWRVLEKMRAMFASLHAEKQVVRVHETRIGLEGERRLCAEFINEAAAQAAWCRAKAIVARVDLVNIEIEPCAP